MKILFLARYGHVGASSRMRMYQYLPFFEQAGIECVVSALFNDVLLIEKYKTGTYSYFLLIAAYWRRFKMLMSARQFDLIWIEKEAMPWFPIFIERWMLRGLPYLLDFDDAIFHNYDLHPSVWVRYFLGRRVDKLMAGSKLVLCGNLYLANRALTAGAQCIEVVPTVVDLIRYSPRQSGVTPFIVWIGSPSSTQYLLELAEPLRILATRMPFTLRVIGAGDLRLMGVDVQPVLWTEETESALIAECDIGIMPLKNNPWEQGKCAYKLVQYMASGLATVSSPVGANLEVVVNGETGLFANSTDEWIFQMELLLLNSAMRKRMGAAGRARVEAKYCIQLTAPILIQLLKETAEA
jgi:glycosyltransferase involved in cell wall biosynthesis